MPELSVVPGPKDDLPVYPISSKERLDSHFFVPWNLRRWNASEFRRAGYQDPEVGWYGMELFWAAHGQTPVGTLPCSDDALAFLLHTDGATWAKLRKRDPSPLHNWYHVRCDTGEIRLAHPVVTEAMVEALEGKRRNAAKNADDRMRKRLGGIADILKRKLGATAAAAMPDELLNKISDRIDEKHPGGSCTEKRVREAWEFLSTQDPRA